MLTLRIFEVLSLGFLCGLIPGPVVSAVFAETLRNGWRAARRIVAWAAAGELVMSVACVAFVSAVDPHSAVFSALSIVGALILLRLAWDLWRVESIKESDTLFTNRRVFTVAILNGMAWIFWLTVCVPQAVALGKLVRGGQWLFIALFEAGWVASTLSLCLAFAFLRRWIQKKEQLHLLYRGVALRFVVFAVRLAWAAAHHSL